MEITENTGRAMIAVQAKVTESFYVSVTSSSIKCFEVDLLQ